MQDKESKLIRSSAAEYLTFVAATGDTQQSFEMRYEDENIWLTQKMMATLYDVDVRTVNDHIKKIYSDAELEESATIRKFRIVQTEGTRQVNREVNHYNLPMIIAVGFKVNNERAVQFRKWANGIVKDYTIQGWVMDEERLKNGGTVLTEKYFEKQLEKIREIRLSERKFYQKITDIYATALDYDPSAKATRRFFAAVQNKLHLSSATTLNVYAHVSDEMRQRAADRIDRGIAGVEPPPNPKPSNQATATPFQAVKGKYRKPGTGCVSQINDHLWEGRYSPKVNGKRIARNIYAPTEAECEEKLAVLITEMKQELALLRAKKPAV